MLGRRVLARPAAGGGKSQPARVISLLHGGGGRLLFDGQDRKQNVQMRDVDAATLNALVAASPLAKVGASIARCTVKGSDDLTNNLKVGEVRMGPLVLEFGTLVRQPVVIVGIYATAEEFSVWLKWLTPLSHPDMNSLYTDVVQGREQLADHGEVVRVARALPPPRAISLSFEDPRVCETLRNNILSVDVAKATE